jgi:hypothetical protein
MPSFRDGHLPEDLFGALRKVPAERRLELLREGHGKQARRLDGRAPW